MVCYIISLIVSLSYKRAGAIYNASNFEEKTKRVMQCDAKMAYVCFSQLTVVGQTGVLGIPVMRPVELVIKSDSETAHNQHLKMAGKIAWEKHSRNSCANCHPALVSKKLGRNICKSRSMTDIYYCRILRIEVTNRWK